MALTTETSTRPSTASQRDICLLHLHLSLRTCVKYDAEVSRTINVLQRRSEAGVTHAAVFTWCKCYMHGGDRHALPVTWQGRGFRTSHGGLLLWHRKSLTWRRVHSMLCHKGYKPTRCACFSLTEESLTVQG